MKTINHIKNERGNDMEKQVRFWYDQQDMDVDNWGWYAIVEEAGEVVTDSLKDFPFAVDLYELDDRDEFRAELQDAFPEHHVIQEDSLPIS